MLEKRVKELLKKVANVDDYEDGYGRVCTSSIAHIIEEAEKLLELDETGIIFNSIRYELIDTKRWNILSELVENEDKIKFVKTYSYDETISELALKYWNNFSKLFKKISEILVVADNSSIEDVRNKSWDELLTNSNKVELKLMEEKEKDNE